MGYRLESRDSLVRMMQPESGRVAGIIFGERGIGCGEPIGSVSPSTWLDADLISGMGASVYTGES